MDLLQKRNGLGVKVASLMGPRGLYDFVRWSALSLYLYRGGGVIRKELYQCRDPRGVHSEVYCGVCVSNSMLSSLL